MQEEKTKEKINKIEKALGIKNQEKDKSTFKTTEVLILILITIIISAIMASIITYRLSTNKYQNVDKHLQEFIDNYSFINQNYNGKADKKELIDAAIEGMLNKLDKNSVFLDKDDSNNLDILLAGEYNGIGIQVVKTVNGIIITDVFKDSPAYKSGVRKNDIIIKVNGDDVQDLSTKELTLKIKEQETISLTYLRDGNEKTVKIKNGFINIESVTSKIYKDNRNAGYIALNIFANNSYDQFKNKLADLENQNINSLIIDLRNNSGGYLSAAENIISLFLNSKHPIYQIQKNSKTTKVYSKGSKDKEYNIIVLVNQNSASASEVVASALKEQYGATIIGTKTFGKGTVQELQDLDDGNKYKLTTKNWLTSKGIWVEGKGIEPDIKLELNDIYYENPIEENDNQLKAALTKAKNN